MVQKGHYVVQNFTSCNEGHDLPVALLVNLHHRSVHIICACLRYMAVAEQGMHKQNASSWTSGVANMRRSCWLEHLACLQMMETPISRAAHNGHLQTVQYLTEQGADVNCLDLVGVHCIVSAPNHVLGTPASVDVHA